MPTKLVTIVDEQVVFFPTWGTLSKEELKRYDQDYWNVLEASTKTFVHGIYDYSGLNGLPPLRELTNLRVGKHPRVGWSVFTGVHNVLLKFFASVTVQFFGQRVRFVDTNADALKFLQSVDATLPDLSRFNLDAVTVETRAVHEKAS
ncbi:MAG: hypothetical protein IPK52_23910 [Chloroflexi bacterium]|nr:hypothetical protein [Chloroflexota bacterium]